MATHSDKCSHIDDYIIPIQVGRSTSKDQFEEITDSTGDNISSKNGIFCELTALYWIWKNVNHEYIGLYHYRRRFNIDKNKIMNILDSGRIILPKQRKFRISIEEQYIKEHSENDWIIMLDTLKEYYPLYYKFSKNVFKSNVLYMFNMFIMNKQEFDKYCEWLFPLLFKIEEKLKNVDRDKYQKRYIGFMAERLFTLYVQYNKFESFESDVLFMNTKIKFINVKNLINNIIFKTKY
ncbi:MAG: DUF4422 domain-containing protein [Clostridium beijerinckii]|nr:DUF4422 domain-containing protein [Clostridium beijerinckii]